MNVNAKQKKKNVAYSPREKIDSLSGFVREEDLRSSASQAAGVNGHRASWTKDGENN